MINNMFYDSAVRLLMQKGGFTTRSDAEAIIARATVSTAYEARTQTLIALYAVLEPGEERESILTEILKRTYE